ncbi:hypothetical protein BKA61DRAFT_667796 [Leptodontidium sp. MPI-SDFR-AT-0119]|nr:hypothetical protein BKA61DRAFT_667796 [Leptodontidium sp. MPI-SDFR-AT-0119]
MTPTAPVTMEQIKSEWIDYVTKHPSVFRWIGSKGSKADRVPPRRQIEWKDDKSEKDETTFKLAYEAESKRWVLYVFEALWKVYEMWKTAKKSAIIAKTFLSRYQGLTFDDVQWIVQRFQHLSAAELIEGDKKTKNMLEYKKPKNFSLVKNAIVPTYLDDPNAKPLDAEPVGGKTVVEEDDGSSPMLQKTPKTSRISSKALLERYYRGTSKERKFRTSSRSGEADAEAYGTAKSNGNDSCVHGDDNAIDKMATTSTELGPVHDEPSSCAALTGGLSDISTKAIVDDIKKDVKTMDAVKPKPKRSMAEALTKAARNRIANIRQKRMADREVTETGSIDAVKVEVEKRENAEAGEDHSIAPASAIHASSSPLKNHEIPLDEHSLEPTSSAAPGKRARSASPEPRQLSKIAKTEDVNFDHDYSEVKDQLPKAKNARKAKKNKIAKIIEDDFQPPPKSHNEPDPKVPAGSKEFDVKDYQFPETYNWRTDHMKGYEVPLENGKTKDIYFILKPDYTWRKIRPARERRNAKNGNGHILPKNVSLNDVKKAKWGTSHANKLDRSESESESI